MANEKRNGKVLEIIVVEDLVNAAPERFRHTVQMLLYEIKDKIIKAKYDAYKRMYYITRKDG